MFKSRFWSRSILTGDNPQSKDFLLSGAKEESGIKKKKGIHLLLQSVVVELFMVQEAARKS
jgi:hypothetical protein